MASAILTAMFPTVYTVCDIRASQALKQKDYGSLRYYVAYLTACRRMTAEYGVSLRDFDPCELAVVVGTIAEQSQASVFETVCGHIDDGSSRRVDARAIDFDKCSLHNRCIKHGDWGPDKGEIESENRRPGTNCSLTC